MTIAGRIAGLALLAVVCGAGMLAAPALGVPGWSAPPRPCPPPRTFAQVKRSLDVFEGVVVDRWNETILDGWRVRVLRTYQFQVLRSWSSSATGTERRLEHGWSEGEPYMEGTYPVFERGRRYLVASVLYDAPAHRFTTSCLPGAEGAAIAPLAAALGPPTAAFVEQPLPEIPIWVPLERGAQDAADFSGMLGRRALRVIALGR